MFIQRMYIIMLMLIYYIHISFPTDGAAAMMASRQEEVLTAGDVPLQWAGVPGLGGDVVMTESHTLKVPTD